MTIGVNARRLQGQRFGIGRYIEYMLKYWDKMLLPSERVNLYVQEPFTEQPLQLSEAFTVCPLRPRVQGVLWENVRLPFKAKDNDVFFGPSYTIPLRYSGRSVVAIHSVNEFQAGAHPWWYQLTYTPWYRLSAQKADRVIVPSEATRIDVQERYGISDEKVDVVLEGADDAFQPIEDQDALSEVRRRYFGRDRPYILFVGKFSQRRNIPTLMEAFGQLKQQHGLPHGLLLVGRNVLGLPIEKLAAKFGIADSLVLTEGRFSSHREMIAVYNAADLYAYPSAYDGFSLTVVEAMACGVPVVTVNRPALREIAGGCSMMIEEPVAEALADAMYRVLSDASLRQHLRTKGLERAKSLRWEDTASQTLAVLRQVAGS